MGPVADRCATHESISSVEIPTVNVNFLSMTSAQFYTRDGLGSSHMLIAKVPAVVAAVLFMSISTQAMEFADRPGMGFDVVSSLPALHFILIDDYSRRQINNINILLPPTVAQTRMVERPKPISNVMPTKVSQSDRPGRLSAEFSAASKSIGIKVAYRPWMVSSRIKTKLVEQPKLVSNIIPTEVSQSDRPGRLSAEFSAVAKASGIKFGHRRPWMVGSRIKPTATSAAMSFEDPISSRFRILAALKIKSEDRRTFTSSLTKIKTPYGLHHPSSSVEFCVGSIAPCGPLSFAQRSEKGLMRAAVARSTTGLAIE
jgi:hypothetical protein